LKPPLIILPPPSRICRLHRGAQLSCHSWHTLSTTLAGFALSVVLGVGLAVAIVNSRLMERIIYTLLVALNSLPKVRWPPLRHLMGTGSRAQDRHRGDAGDLPRRRRHGAGPALGRSDATALAW
jgi:NitT/TauT family transport system permease protein